MQPIEARLFRKPGRQLTRHPESGIETILADLPPGHDRRYDQGSSVAKRFPRTKSSTEALT